MARIDSHLGRRRRTRLQLGGPSFVPLRYMGGGGGSGGRPKKSGGGILGVVGDVVNDVADTVADAAGDVVDAVGSAAGSAASAASTAYTAAGGEPPAPRRRPGRSTVSLAPPMTPLSMALAPKQATELGTTLGRLLTPAGALQALLGGNLEDQQRRQREPHEPPTERHPPDVHLADRRAGPRARAALARQRDVISRAVDDPATAVFSANRPGRRRGNRADPLGPKTLGDVSAKELMAAGRQGAIQLNAAGKLTIPATRRAARDLTAAQEAVIRTSSGPLPGLTPSASRVARRVLRTGEQEEDATLKELLAASETGLVESHFENLQYGDADSKGWRQERTSIYGDGPAGPNNVRASARRFFEESIGDTGGTRGRGLTAGQLAQTIQGSAFPERYDQVKPEAWSILRGYQEGSQPDPKTAQALQLAKRNARAEGINPTRFNGDVDGGGRDFTIVRADAKGMVDWAESALGTPEGTAKQQRWAANYALGRTEPWCANFVSNGLARRGITDLPSNPNYVPSYESEWGQFAVDGGLAKAKPGDLLTFNGSHIGVYVGNGEMVSGNSSDAVSRTSAGAPSMVIRPPYKGGKVRVEDAQIPGSSLGSALGGGSEVVGGATLASAAGALGGGRPATSAALTQLAAPISAGPALPESYLGAPEEEDHAAGAAESILALLGEDQVLTPTRRPTL